MNENTRLHITLKKRKYIAIAIAVIYRLMVRKKDYDDRVQNRFPMGPYSEMELIQMSQKCANICD